MPCPACGTDIANPGKFCPECGAPLAAVAPASPERRQLTVMFCDLVSSTVLSATLDPEELREILREYQAACHEVIKRYEGHIAQYLGDGLLVYFGHPRAHEDDARRAGHAALEILQAMDALSARLRPRYGFRLAVRLGIHTGPIVLGDIGAGERTDRLAVGETPNVAAKLQGRAEHDTVVVSEATHRLLQGYFTSRDLGSVEIAGLSKPIRAFQLIAESGVTKRLDVAATAAGGLTPFVGRASEVARLLECWQSVRTGIPQTACVVGEAGLGKSRLIEVLKDFLAGTRATVLDGSCSPYYQNSSLFAITDLLQRWARLTRGDTPAQKLAALERAVAPLALTEPFAVQLLASLLSVPLDGRHPPLALDAQRQRQKTFEVVIAVLRAVAADQPLLLVLEDLHWADPSTLELLTLYMDQSAQSRILTVLTFRPEFSAPWSGRPETTTIEITGLDVAQSEELIARTSRGKPLPSEVVARIVERADGIPLFIEETVKAIIESGALRDAGTRYELAGPLPDSLIPTTLQDALMARLDRLGSAKSLAQLGAAIGRQFPYDVLHAVAALDDARLTSELERVVASGLLQRQGTPPHATYVFKHALVQQAAYESLLRATRQTHHQRIATVLEERFPETVEQHPELLAHQCSEAGDVARAVPYWQKAGARAVARAAFAEAIDQLSRGVKLLESLPENAARDRQEIDLQTALGMALQARRGYGAAEVDRAYARARELCQRSGDVAKLISVLRGQQLFYTVRADYRTGLDVGQQLLKLAEREGNTAYMMEAHLALGLDSLYLGEFSTSQRHFEQCAALYDPNAPGQEAFQAVGHSAAMCLSYLGRTLWILGYPDQAVERSLAGIEIAKKMAIPMSRAQALGMHTVLYHVRREVDAVDDWARQTTAFATEHGLLYWVLLSSIIQGWATAEHGDGETGIAQFRRGLDKYLATGSRVGTSWFFSVLAEMWGKNGQMAQAFDALEQALAQINTTGERHHEAEVYRLQGELMLMRGGADASVSAEASFRRAIEVARRQRAKGWELRVATSLARLLNSHGRTAEAREALADVYSWFTEGFDTPDLVDARLLRTELSATAQVSR